MVLTGLDVLAAENFSRLRGRRLGVLCNQASIARDCRHILDLLEQAQLNVQAVFGPQHGLYGHTQDNMIEWEGYVDPRTGWRIHSLYGEHRKPTPQMLEGIDLMVIDLQDVGSRYYTFIWTMDLTLQACTELGIPVLVLDRPNPIGGIQIEGPLLQPEFTSFVGLRPIPIRHALTIGEMALYMGDAQVVEIQGWRRDMYFDQTGLPWAMPSPNMPTPDTAIVYPGGCLLEATNLSEGRGTTRPFEIVGSPHLAAHRFVEELNALNLPGVYFRPLQFQPTFNKYAGRVCDGCFVHVRDRQTYQPVLTYIAILQTAVRQSGAEFQWKRPPYEYEFEKRPIDILAGNSWLADAIESDDSPRSIASKMEAEVGHFTSRRLY